MGFGPLPGGLKPWNSAQTLFDGANLYYSDGTTFVDSSGNVTITGGTMDGVVIGGSTPVAATFASLVSDGNIKIESNSLLFWGGRSVISSPQDGVIRFLNDDQTAGSALQIIDLLSPSTPTGGFLLYSISGQPHTLDVNAVDINLSLCLQPDTGWASNSAVGNKATSLPVYIATSTILNTTDPGSAQQIQALTDKVAALQLQASLGLYANA